MTDTRTRAEPASRDGHGPHTEQLLFFNSPALEQLFERERARIAPALEPHDFEPGEVLCRPEDAPKGVFLILSGEVAVSRRAPGRAFLPVEILRRGDVLAALALERSAPNEGRFAVTARAITKASTLLLPWRRFDELRSEVPELAAAIAAFNDLRAARRRFLAALRRSLPFRTTSPRRLNALFEAAEILEAAPGTQLTAQGEPPCGLHFIIEGELSATEQHGGTLRAHVQELYPDDLFGDLALMLGSEPATVVVVRRARLLRVPLDKYEQQLGASASFRRSIGHTTLRAGAQAGEAPRHTIEVLLLQSDIPRAPLGILTDVLAQTLASDHGDDVAILELAAAAPGEPLGVLPRPTPDPALPRLARLRVPVPAGPSAVAAIEDALTSLDGVYEQVFLDASNMPEGFGAELAPVLSDHDGRRIGDRLVSRGKVVFLSRDPLAQRLPRALRAVPIASAVLVPDPGSQTEVRAVRGTSRERIYPSGTARVRLDLERLSTLRRPEDRRIGALPAATRATLSRWGRAITERSVGVALGGGGAWGFAHVALLRAIHVAGIPVDMVSGSSFGALAGAFYCAEGLAGLDLLLDTAEEANRATTLSMLSSTALAAYVDRKLGRRRLEHLEVALYPVATDLASSTEHVVSCGTLGEGVRASGAFPGMFTPVTGGGTYCVDGAFINNVPASVLVTEGADLVVASNIVAAPSPIVPSEPLFKGRVGRLLHEFNPLTRPLDLIRAGFVLMHTSGQRESEFADVMFESEPVELEQNERRTLRDRLLRGKIAFWDFTVGPDVARKAEPKVQATIEQLKARWEQLSRGHAAAARGSRSA